MHATMAVMVDVTLLVGMNVELIVLDVLVLVLQHVQMIVIILVLQHVQVFAEILAQVVLDVLVVVVVLDVLQLVVQHALAIVRDVVDVVNPVILVAKILVALLAIQPVTQIALHNVLELVLQVQCNKEVRKWHKVQPEAN